jgi:hypothetical protein
VSKYEPEQASLGAKSVGWSPSGQLLAIGGYDQRVKISFVLFLDIFSFLFTLR